MILLSINYIPEHLKKTLELRKIRSKRYDEEKVKENLRMHFTLNPPIDGRCRDR
jgi:hypothetical protein